MLDGEIVAFDRDRISRFLLLQRRAQGEPVRLAYAAFDCLQRAGVSLLRQAPLPSAAMPSRRSCPSGRLSWRSPAAPKGLTAYRRAQERW